MASAEVASSPAAEQRPLKRRPFANFVKRLTHFKSSDQKKEENGKKAYGGGAAKYKKNNSLPGKNNPYPQSGHLHEEVQHASQPSLGTSTREPYERDSSLSLPQNPVHDQEGHNGHSNKSGAPTLATNAETVHSDAGNSRAVTTSTGAGALSTAGANSTFSSPNHSLHSLATTLTTIQSTGTPVNGAHGSLHYNGQSQPNGSQFSHQYPVSPGPSAAITASAIPRHLHTDSTSVANTPDRKSVV